MALGPAAFRIRPGQIVFAPKARNFLLHEISHPCARPWYVYVQTFLPAFIKLFFTLILLQLDDVIRDYAAVRAGEGPSGARRKGSHFKKLKGAQAGTVTQRVFRQGLRTVLKVTMPLEVIGFATLMYTAGDQFFYDWQSLLKLSDFCSRPAFTGPLSRDNPPGIVVPRPTGQGFGYDDLIQNRASWFTTPLSCVVPEGNIDVFATLSAKRILSDLDDVSLGLVIIVGGKIKIFKSTSIKMLVGIEYDFIVRAEVRANIGQTANISWVMFGPQTLSGVVVSDGDMHVTNNIS